MGKYVLLIVMSVVGVWGLSMVQLQSSQNSAETEADYQKQMLARQVARSGLNVIRAQASNSGEQCPSDIVQAVSQLQGEHQSDDYDHGEYTAWLEESTVDLSYRAIATGTFQGETEKVSTLVRVDVSSGGLFYVQSGSSDRLAQHPGSGVSGYTTAPQVKAMAPLEVDLDNDGRKEIPYVRKSNGKIEMVDSQTQNQGDAQTLVESNEKSNGKPNENGQAEPATSKSRLAVGEWDGSDPSVFYANSNNDAIYKISWSPNGGGNKNQNDPEKIAGLTNSRNGAQAVVGIADVNGDSGEELVFVDGSQQLRYIDEPSEPNSNGGSSFTKISGGGVGSSAGIGAGELVDLNGDGTSSIVFVNGSNNIKIVNDAGTNRTIKVDNVDGGNGPGAAKMPPTVTDMDGDGDLEVVYGVNGRDKLQYVDADPENPESPSVTTISNISLKKGPGLQSKPNASPC